jgi:hypothetical protein
MKLRLIKTWNGKPVGATGVFLSDFGAQLVADGIAEHLDDDFVVEQMPEKKVQETLQTIYIPVPMPMQYFEDENDLEKIDVNIDLSKVKK